MLTRMKGEGKSDGGPYSESGCQIELQLKRNQGSCEGPFLVYTHRHWETRKEHTQVHSPKIRGFPAQAADTRQKARITDKTFAKTKINVSNLSMEDGGYLGIFQGLIADSMGETGSYRLLWPKEKLQNTSSFITTSILRTAYSVHHLNLISTTEYSVVTHCFPRAASCMTHQI